MRLRGLGDKLILVLGDLVAFGVALRLSFYLRELFSERELSFFSNLLPFVFIFLVWIVVFFVFGLYDKRSLTSYRGLPLRLLRLQVGNSLIAVLFFYFIPVFAVAPRTLLVINLCVSFVLLLLWRMVVVRTLGKGKREIALLVGESVSDLESEINAYPFFGYSVVSIPKWDDSVTLRVRDEKIRTIICNPLALEEAGRRSDLSELIFRGVRIVDRRDLYEEIMLRVPLNFISESWVLRHIALPQRGYDISKRIMDIVIALPLAILSLVFYPFIIVAIKIQDGGPVFYERTRVGQMNKLFKMRKFRSMTGTDMGGEVLKTKLSVTPLGIALRKTRLDELPQLWNVIKGELSLVGPRPEFPEMVEEYKKAIPYYNLRHIVKPGLSGWAQLYQENHPHHGTAVEQTREKLSYDLYYVKNRSIFLDIAIALKTIRTLLSRTGL